jgi:hypothetical protein
MPMIFAFGFRAFTFAAFIAAAASAGIFSAFDTLRCPPPPFRIIRHYCRRISLFLLLPCQIFSLRDALMMRHASHALSPFRRRAASPFAAIFAFHAFIFIISIFSSVAAAAAVFACLCQASISLCLFAFMMPLPALMAAAD